MVKVGATGGHHAEIITQRRERVGPCGVLLPTTDFDGAATHRSEFRAQAGEFAAGKSILRRMSEYGNAAGIDDPAGDVLYRPPVCFYVTDLAGAEVLPEGCFDIADRARRDEVAGKIRPTRTSA